MEKKKKEKKVIYSPVLSLNKEFLNNTSELIIVAIVGPGNSLP